MTFDAQCGSRLKKERERLGLSQQEIADKISIRREMWSRYERGQASPGGDALAAFLRMGGNLIYVLTGDSEFCAATEDERELLTSYRKLDVRTKAGVLGMIGGFTASTTATNVAESDVVAHAHNIEGSGNYVVHGNRNKIASGGSQSSDQKKKKS